jgi:tRNA synthetases class I (E and Q), catalytic domain
VANRRFADERRGRLLLRIDDTDAPRTASDAESGILRDLEWLGVAWDEGPIRQTDRRPSHAAAADRLLASGEAEEDAGAVRFRPWRGRPTLVRADGRPTYHLASVVDDVELGITHVIRGKDHLSNRPLHEAIARALGAEPPAYVHHGLVLGPDGAKLSKRHGAASLGDLRRHGFPPEAVRAYLDELGLPRSDVRLDLDRLRRLSVEALAAISDEELAERIDVPRAVVPAVRGAHDLREAAAIAAELLDAPPPAELDGAAVPTLERFRALRDEARAVLEPADAHALVADVRASGGKLRALRLALTGRERGPELWTVVLALPRDESVRRVRAAIERARAPSPPPS